MSDSQGAPSFVSLTKQYIHDLKDFSQNKPVSLYAWANLFPRTNGIVNDVTSVALRQRRPRQRFGATSGLLGNFSAARRRDIVKTLDRDGYYIFPEKMPVSILDGIESAARRTSARLYPPPENGLTNAVYDPANPLGPVYWYDQKLVNLPETQKLMIDENFVAIASDYLRTDPILDSAQAWLSIPFQQAPSSAGAQLFHYDLSHLQWIKIYVYLTDVTAETGPHVMVPGTHLGTDFVGAKLRRRGQVRIPDEDIAATYGADKPIEITGPRGTVFAVDTRSFHKGKMPAKGERIMFELYYVNSDFGVSTPPEPIRTATAEFLEAKKRWPRLLNHYPIETASA